MWLVRDNLILGCGFIASLHSHICVFIGKILATYFAGHWFKFNNFNDLFIRDVRKSTSEVFLCWQRRGLMVWRSTSPSSSASLSAWCCWCCLSGSCVANVNTGGNSHTSPSMSARTWVRSFDLTTSFMPTCCKKVILSNFKICALLHQQGHLRAIATCWSSPEDFMTPTQYTTMYPQVPMTYLNTVWSFMDDVTSCCCCSDNKMDMDKNRTVRSNTEAAVWKKTDRNKWIRNGSDILIQCSYRNLISICCNSNTEQHKCWGRGNIKRETQQGNCIFLKYFK